MPPLSTTQLQKYLPSSPPSVTTPPSSTTTTTSSSSSPPTLLPERPQLLSQPSQQLLPSNHLPSQQGQQQQQQQPLSNHHHHYHPPAPISRWLPDSSTFVIKSYLPMKRHRPSSNNNRIELVAQNYCLLHKTYYAYSWCPSCQTDILF